MKFCLTMIIDIKNKKQAKKMQEQLANGTGDFLAMQAIKKLNKNTDDKVLGAHVEEVP